MLHLEEPSVGLFLQVFIGYFDENLLKPNLLPPKLDDSFLKLSNVPLVCIISQESPLSQDVDLVEPRLQNLFEPKFVHFGVNLELVSSVFSLFVSLLSPYFEDRPQIDLA